MTAKPMFVRVLAVALLAMMSVFVAACATSVASDPVELVPDRATIVGSVDLPEILNDPDVGEFYTIIAEANDDPEMPQTLEELLAWVEEESGLDLTTMGPAVFFGDISGFDTAGLELPESGEPGYFGFIASGAPDGLFDTVKESADDELAEAEYKGVALLESTDGEMSIAIVDGAAVLGTPEAVRGVIDVDQGDAEAFGGDLHTFYESLGDVWGKAVLTVPAEAKEELTDMSGEDIGLPVDIAALLDVEAVGISGDKDGEDGVLRIVLRYASEQQATDAKEMIDALMTLVTMFAGDDPSLEALDNFEITTDGTDLIIESRESIEEAKAQLRQLIESTDGMMGF